MGHEQVPRIILSGDHEAAGQMSREGMRQLDILKNLMGFQQLKQDVRRVRYIDRSEIVCKSTFGIDSVQIYVPRRAEVALSSKLYVYVTISDYATIWDLETGEAAKDIYSNSGLAIEFPCHKDELTGWLSGIEDKPTRQVLKDNPKDRKDYLADNHKDMGEENRIEKANPEDPSFNCYYGIDKPITFTNVINESYDECEPICCDISYPDCPLNLGACTQFTKNKCDTPLNVGIESKDSFTCDSLTFFLYDWYKFSATHFMCKAERRLRRTINSMEYLQTYFLNSKHLYLCTYPSPKYSPILSTIYISYCCPKTTCYENPINFEVDRTNFDCEYTLIRPYSFQLSTTGRSGKSISIRTEIGDLLLDYTPKRECEENRKMLYEIMSEAADGSGCYAVDIPEGVCSKVTEFEVQTSFWENSVYDRPEHATYECGWSKREEHVLVDDLSASENTRTGVSWCGSNYDYRDLPESQTSGWYRVLLRFTMGKFFTEGDVSEYCPYEKVIIEEWDNRAASKRFSSVQATIELECPEDYPKEKSIRYRRPEIYSSLCAFPGRECGYSESKENSTCHPFDGTYDIYTLGEVVEELINNCYVDGSDDPLLVYLLKKPDLTLKLKGQKYDPEATVVEM